MVQEVSTYSEKSYLPEIDRQEVTASHTYFHSLFLPQTQGADMSSYEGTNLSELYLDPVNGLSTHALSYRHLNLKLTSYLVLKDNWDGYEAVPPRKDAVSSAINFALELMNRGICCPKAMLSSDGEVGLYYEEETFFVDIGFEEESLFSYFATDFSKVSMGGEDLPISDGLPQELFEFILQATKPSITSSLCI